jgi:serine/threonine-protein kinase HipA
MRCRASDRFFAGAESGQSPFRRAHAQDMNPSIDRTESSLAINEVETARDMSIAIDAHKLTKDYSLSAGQARLALNQVRAEVATRREEANRSRISRRDRV